MPYLQWDVTVSVSFSDGLPIAHTSHPNDGFPSPSWEHFLLGDLVFLQQQNV